MTGLVLVVDDVPANVKLLEAKLSSEYYDVITANDGFKAIEAAKEHKPDLILLDVMMPGMDGFETCRKLKEDHNVSHIPVVMVTALSEPSDRVQGLESGADDFITKPINDTALFARVRSLIRIKVLIDELRLRDQSGSQMGINGDDNTAFNPEVAGAHILVVDDDAVQSRRVVTHLSAQYHVDLSQDTESALEYARTRELDLVVVNMCMSEVDSLRLSTQIKALESARNVPIIMLVNEEEPQLMLKGLELGLNDYLMMPVDYNELTARSKTQIRRKKYQDALKANYQESVSMAITDGLTGLYNRHYLDTHLKNLVERSHLNNKPMSLIIMDMDHFKDVNDSYGHDVGDEVLKQLSGIIVRNTRSADLAARFGGEEFVILMPETDAEPALDAAERIRQQVEDYEFVVSHAIGILRKTTSIGVAHLSPNDTAETLMKRADTNLYEAKNTGRNLVIASQAGVTPIVAPPNTLSPHETHAAPVNVPVESAEGMELATEPQAAAPALTPQQPPATSTQEQAPQAPVQPQQPAPLPCAPAFELAPPAPLAAPTIPTLDSLYKTAPEPAPAPSVTTPSAPAFEHTENTQAAPDGNSNHIDPNNLQRPALELELVRPDDLKPKAKPSEEDF